MKRNRPTDRRRITRNPMDRMLIATALCNDLTIITDDAAFAAYGVPTNLVR
jgi:PIN domain nuclease of toxin-antitoxin system